MKKSGILVSVIIPTYNRGSTIQRAVNSVLAQTYDNFEIIVIDNFSNDGTEQLIKGYVDDRVNFVQTRNEGVIAHSRNKGIEMASGEVIAFLDSDDWWRNDKIEKSLEFLCRGFDLVYHGLVIYRHKYSYSILNKKRISCRALKEDVFSDLLSRGNTIPTSSVMVKKSAIDCVRGFSEDVDLIAGEDFELWLRLARKGFKFGMVPHYLGYYSISCDAETNSYRTISYIENILELYGFKNCSDYPLWASRSIAKAYFNSGQMFMACKLILAVIYSSALKFIRSKQCRVLP